MEKLFTTNYGSKLYGTQTPTSDTDLKHIILPELDTLLLAKKVENKVKKTNAEKNTRNGVDDVDEEFIPLQIFARHFVEGQTYAIELAFALEGNHAEQQIFDPRGEVFMFKTGHGKSTITNPMVTINHDGLAGGSKCTPYFVEFVKELRTKFLTSNIKAMMGYVVNQASLYSFKGERLNATRDFREVLMHAYTDTSAGDDPLTGFVNTPQFVKEFSELQAKYPKYFKISEYDIGGERMRPCFVVLEKTFPHTNTLGQSLMVIDTLIKKYGSRADQASETNVDWKATMHALRIVDEGIELLSTKKITLPFKQDYVDRLLSIKRGELPLEPIKEELSAKLDMLKELEKSTDLPTCNAEFMKEFDAWMAAWMRKFYNV